jgi:ADP-ribose pyrophosphatase YjhB (NUDIX family)
MDGGRIRESCPSCGWVFYRQLKVSSATLILQDGRILLAKRAHEPWQGAWNMPAGYVEEDETPMEAAIRETAEETGLKVDQLHLVDVYSYSDDPRGKGIVCVFRAGCVDGTQQATEETSEIRWFSPNEVMNLQLAGASADVAILEWARKNME